jgi:hypothetical protein
VTFTGFPKTFHPATLATEPAQGLIAAPADWTPIAMWTSAPPLVSGSWWIAGHVDVVVDEDTVVEARLATQLAETTRVARFTGSVIGTLLGWEQVPPAERRIYLEVRRTSGTGGLRVLEASCVLAYAPLGPSSPASTGPTYPVGYTPPAAGALAAPVNTGLPQISGTPQVGATVACSTGTWSANPVPTYAYEWRRAGVAISGATSSSYAVVTADDQLELTCQVTATNSQGSSAAVSAPVLVDVQAPVNTTTPQISGTPQVGSVLACTTGGWDANPTPTFGYQWLRNGLAIPGATASTLLLATVDLATQVSCQVTATNSQGSATAVSSSVTVTAPAGTGNDGTSVTFRSLSFLPPAENDALFFGQKWPVASSTPTPVGSGVFRDFNSDATWVTARNAAGPGDVLRQTGDFTSANGISARSDLWGVSGANMDRGTPGLPITIWGNGHTITVASTTNNLGVIDVLGTEHVHVIGCHTVGGQFGIRYYAVLGTETHPLRIAHNTITDCGHSAFKIQGWFASLASGAPDQLGGLWGWSKYAIVEANTIARPGRSNTQFGEGIYFGAGSPGWVSRAEAILCRYNDISEYTADGIDCKPGCLNIRILDNTIRAGGAHFGAALGLMYVSTTIPERPSWASYDPIIIVEGNRVWDLNLTNPVVSSAPWLAYYGMAGIRMSRNLFWANPAGNAAVRARIERPNTSFLPPGQNHPSWVANNLMWTSIGFERAGSGHSSTGNYVATGLNNGVSTGGSNSINVIERGNLGPVGATLIQRQAATSNFRQAAAIPAVGAAGNAVWAAGGNGFNGSAFDWDPASPLVGLGPDLSDLVLSFSDDITQRLAAATERCDGPFNAIP